jgi:para-nitrobenzyl esterase
VAAGRGAEVDLLIGVNTEEGNLYLAPSGAYATSTAADVHAAAERSHPVPASLVEVYRRSRPEAADSEVRSTIMGDALFGAGSWALTEAHAAYPQSGTYNYAFAWRSQALDGELGATHTVELPFVFDVVSLPRLHGAKALLGPDLPPPELARRVHGAWIDFAKTGSPGWDRYDPARRVTMIIDAEWRQVEDHRAAERQAWS